MSESPSQASTRKSRLRLRFGLRGLLLATAVVGLALTVGVAWIAPYRMQMQARAVLGDGNSVVMFNTRMRSTRRLGEFFNQTYLVELTGGNTDLHALEGLRFLEKCGIHDRKLSSAEIEVLAGLDWLIELDLSHCELSAEDIPLLARLKNLKSLDVAACGLSEQSLDELRAALPNLEIYDD